MNKYTFNFCVVNDKAKLIVFLFLFLFLSLSMSKLLLVRGGAIVLVINLRKLNSCYFDFAYSLNI